MIRRSAKHAVIGGVCSGYAISEKLPVALVRTFAAALLFLTVGGAVILYIAAWIFMPAPLADAPEKLPAEDKLVRKKSRQVIGGVCGALADYFKIDATVLRAIAVISVFVLGTGLFLYFFAWVVIPEEA
jgi:phage shock protein PspC (stress-responsive transcriptional regulator)